MKRICSPLRTSINDGSNIISFITTLIVRAGFLGLPGSPAAKLGWPSCAGAGTLSAIVAVSPTASATTPATVSRVCNMSGFSCLRMLHAAHAGLRHWRLRRPRCRRVALRRHLCRLTLELVGDRAWRMPVRAGVLVVVRGQAFADLHDRE